MAEVMFLAVKSFMLAVCVVEQNYILETVSALIIGDRFGAALCVLTLR